MAPSDVVIAISRGKSIAKSVRTAPMDVLFDRIVARSEAIDEVLSEPVPGAAYTSDSDLAEQRIAAWARSSANGDSGLFRRRLARDGLSYQDVRDRFATVRHRAA